MKPVLSLSALYPGSFFLDPFDTQALCQFLQTRGWLQPEESVQAAERAGGSNMNCVLRVRTDKRSFILKQSRPWVEKYPQIPAPWNRACIEARFYEEARKDSALAPHLPKLLGFDAAERLLMFEDLGPTPDLRNFYQAPQNWMGETDWQTPLHFLLDLHTRFRDPALSAVFSNGAMRRLNHEHIFWLPLRQDNGLNLDAITPGLARLAEQLQTNADYVGTVGELGKRYLGDTAQEGSLLHGDYFPGSWVKAGGKFYVIDPEFSFYGPPEWDVGVMAAHLLLAGHPAESISRVPEWYSAAGPWDERLMRQFAGTEIMRRLIGVAQLPLPYGLDRKRELLQRSLDLVLGRSVA